MKMFHILTYLCFSIILIISSNVKSPTYQVGISTGYYNGISWQLQVEVLDFATNFSLTPRLAIGHTYLDSGNSAAARRILLIMPRMAFRKKAVGTWNYRFDLLFPIKLKSIPNANYYLARDMIVTKVILDM
jgi:hypothetical protein